MALLASMALSAPSRAAVVQPTATNLTSTADRMVSYRHQEHSWITEDTHTQLIYNRGVQESGDALQLASSIDGVTWVPKFSFAGTDHTSTSDSHYKNGVLSVVYSGTERDIRFATLRYDADTRGWQPTGDTQIVRPATKGLAASNPTLVEDDQGNVWVVYLHQVFNSSVDEAKTQLRLLVRAKGSTSWIDTNVKFGGTGINPLEAPKRSARLVRTPTGLGVVYSVEGAIYWQQRSTTGGFQEAWSPRSTMVAGTSGQTDTDPYASHFSLATDGDGFMHLVYTDGGVAYYRRYNAQPDVLAWSSQAIPLSKDIGAAYPQVSWLGGKRLAVVFDAHPAGKLSKLFVYQSDSRGAKDSFKCTSLLVHPNPQDSSEGISFLHMRSEMPSVATGGSVPLVMQYEQTLADAVSYKAYAYRFSASSTEGCAN
ncbi:hypothetical protein [Ideonella sp.]|uniref:hypothetical protein n=1 Tax=Ideonella sp. TaxID=1929293 RepID=UPI003BB72D30